MRAPRGLLRRLGAFIRSDRRPCRMPEPDTIEHRNARAIAEWYRKRPPTSRGT